MFRIQEKSFPPFPGRFALHTPIFSFSFFPFQPSLPTLLRATPPFNNILVPRVSEYIFLKQVRFSHFPSRSTSKKRRKPNSPLSFPRQRFPFCGWNPLFPLVQAPSKSLAALPSHLSRSPPETLRFSARRRACDLFPFGFVCTFTFFFFPSPGFFPLIERSVACFSISPSMKGTSFPPTKTSSSCFFFFFYPRRACLAMDRNDAFFYPPLPPQRSVRFEPRPPLAVRPPATPFITVVNRSFFPTRPR